MRGRRTHGFTLIELVVVVAIIVVMLTILLPVPWRAKERVHRRTCPSNLRQIGMALQMYSSDHDEMTIAADPVQRPTRFHYPPADAIWSVQRGCPIHLGTLFPYVRNLDLFYCPAANVNNGPSRPNGGGKELWGRHDPAAPSYLTARASYLWRSQFAGGSLLWSDNAQRAMLLDENIFARHLLENSRYSHGCHEDEEAGQGIYSADFVNVLYGDGHVKGYNTPHNELSGPLFHLDEQYYGGAHGTEGMFGRIFFTADYLGSRGDD